jgi:DNA polymerase (family 10)
MSVGNAEIARILTRYATLLEIEGANPFRVRAYRNAALVIQGLARSVADLLRDGEDLTQLEGIGEDLAGKIKEIVTTGRLGKLEEIEKRLPAALVELTTLPGLGPKRVKLLYDRLKTRSLEDLERAARAGRVRAIRGFGPKTEEKILHALTQRRGREARLAWLEAEHVAGPLVGVLAATPGVKAVVVAGSFRRCRETVGDLDLVISCDDSAPVMQRFVAYEDVAQIVASGTTRATVRLRNGVQVDLRVVPEASYGAALQYFTGSKAHNIALRARAVKRGLKLSEYGLFKDKSASRVARSRRSIGGSGCPTSSRSCARTVVRLRQPRAASCRSSSRSTICAGICIATRTRRMAATASKPWPAARRSSATSTSRSAITRGTCASRTASTASDWRASSRGSIDSRTGSASFGS